MKPIELPEVHSKRWPQQQCTKCKIVFTLSPLDVPSGVKASDILLDELDRHAQQNHIDLSSAWKAENQSR
jgi:hypothetical protein